MGKPDAELPDVVDATSTSLVKTEPIDPTFEMLAGSAERMVTTLAETERLNSRERTLQAQELTKRHELSEIHETERANIEQRSLNERFKVEADLQAKKDEQRYHLQLAALGTAVLFTAACMALAGYAAYADKWDIVLPIITGIGGTLGGLFGGYGIGKASAKAEDST